MLSVRRVRYSDCDVRLVDEYPDLLELIERLGSLQIRNQGTIGGNIGNASPIGDMPPALISLGTELVLRRADTQRRIALEDYFIGYKSTAQQPGEFIEKILIPKAKPGQQLRVHKISKRFDDDISSTCGAFNIELDNSLVRSARIAFGGMAEIPKRALACEAALTGQRWCEATIDNAMQALAGDFEPISDFRASSRYRMQVSQNMLRRLFLELSDPGNNVRVIRYA